jgi:hypothetical protein
VVCWKETRSRQTKGGGGDCLGETRRTRKLKTRESQSPEYPPSCFDVRPDVRHNGNMHESWKTYGLSPRNVWHRWSGRNLIHGPNSRPLSRLTPPLPPPKSQPARVRDMHLRRVDSLLAWRMYDMLHPPPGVPPIRPRRPRLLLGAVVHLFSQVTLHLYVLQQIQILFYNPPASVSAIPHSPPPRAQTHPSAACSSQDD